ncbi:hypothetical protein BGW38_001237 [Lunasporangiospora selenospora]|uniref:Uncharacterized protein n=1 Tax=Lunasporangiospora selenospora TaxID=979761 RepID=A0A9P6KHG5_9FUNG|nr:hypothetical protein BGW38_001237 [Lunasporangiospora selenospora]
MDNTDINPRPSLLHDDPAPSQPAVIQEHHDHDHAGQLHGQERGRSKSHDQERQRDLHDMALDRDHPSHRNLSKTLSRDHLSNRVHRSGSVNSIANSSSFSGSLHGSYDRLSVDMDGLTHHQRLAAAQELDDQSGGNSSILNPNPYLHEAQDSYSQTYQSRKPLESEDEPQPHVHSQTCQDSCPVQDIYTEISYSRFGRGARTNLYGLVVIKEIGKPSQPAQAQAESFPSSTLSSLSSYFSVDPSAGLDSKDFTESRKNAPSEADNTTAHSKDPVPTSSSTPTLPVQNPVQEDGSRVRKTQSIFTASGSARYHHLPGRYALVAAGNIIQCFMGLQESFEFSVGKTSLTIVPTSEEIVSMDAFERKDERGCQLIIVVSIAKADDTDQFELRIFGVNTFAPSIRELLLALPGTTDFQCIPIAWAPTKIIHAPLEDDPFEMAILVGGSDSCVHFFVQSPGGVGLYEEHPVGTHFSVLASFSYCEYCVLSLAIQDYADCRIVAAGTQNGTLNVGVIPRNPDTFQLDRDNAKSHTVVLFAPITTLSVFVSRVPTDQKWKQRKQAKEKAHKEGLQRVDSTTEQDDIDVDIGFSTNDSREDEGIHLLVTCATEQAWIYSDITKNALTQRTDLAECAYHDSILASHVMDADWDGRNEILVGTYGRQLMVFKELAPGQGPYGENSVLSANVASMSSMSLPQTQHHHQQQQQQQQQHRLVQPQSHQHLHLNPPPSQLHPNHHHHSQQHHQQQHQHHAYSRSGSQYHHLYQPHSNSPLSISPNSVPSSLMPRALSEPSAQYGMTWNRRLATPVYGVSSADLNDDGLEELVVTTMDGVSIFLPDPITAKRRLVRAVERMKDIEQMRRLVEQLRGENQSLVEQKRLREEEEERLRLEEQERQGKEVKRKQQEVEEQIQAQQSPEQQKEGDNDEKDEEKDKQVESDTEAQQEPEQEEPVLECLKVSTQDKNSSDEAAAVAVSSDLVDSQPKGQPDAPVEDDATAAAPAESSPDPVPKNDKVDNEQPDDDAAHIPSDSN